MIGGRQAGARRGERGPGIRVLAVALWVAVVGLAAACSEDEPGASGAPARVEVVRVRVGPMPVRREYVGNVRSMSQVQVRARVRGYLIEQHVEDGAAVSAGDLLFRIDPAPFQVALAEARAELARARADAIRAARDLERARQLFRDDVVSTAVVDQRRAERDASAAAVEAAEAGVESAELDLSYCSVRAPITGRMGRALVEVGSLVGESGQDTVLAELVQEDPIHVYFAVPESASGTLAGAVPEDVREALSELASEDEARTRTSGDATRSSSTPSGASSSDTAPSSAAPTRAGEGLSIRLRLGDGSVHPHEGVVDYVSPTVDATRGTLTVRARVPNPERALRPGRFVRVIAVFPDEPEAVLIPQRAVLQEQGGSYVWLVQEDGTVQRRAIRLGRMLDRLQQVEEGLSDGERVVVDGVQGLRSGDPVQVRSEPEPEAEPEPEPG